MDKVEKVGEELAKKHFYMMGKLRQLYLWVLSWAGRPFATWALFFLAIAESSFFPIPPDVLLLPMCVSKPRKALWFGFVCVTGSVIGGILGYWIGWGFFETIGEPIIYLMGSEAQFAAVGELFHQNAFIAILAAALTPIPYKVFTIAAGLWKVPLLPFLLASIIGRGARFFSVAILLYFFGAPVKKFIDRYFDLITIFILIIIIAGFLSIKFLM